MRSMTKDEFPLSQEEFEFIYSKVPRLTVEILLKDKTGAVFLTKRAIEPCKGQWHLPGGTVYFGEAMIDAVRRIARRELHIEIEKAKDVGCIEYPSHYQNGLDSPFGVVFEVEEYKGGLSANEESESSGWFKKLPENTHADQDKFLTSKGYLR